MHQVIYSLQLLVSLIISIPVVLGDVLVIMVTWISTARIYIRARNSGVKAPLASLLLRDGALLIRY